jgi:putative transposase
MTVASFIAAQRTNHGVPHAKCCRWLNVKPSTFYKCVAGAPTPRQQHRDRLDSAVKESFDESGGTPGTYGSPRVWEDLDEAGWAVSLNTVASSMARQGLVGRSPKRKRRSLTRPDKAAAPIRDLVQRDYSTGPVNQRWCGDLTEIPTGEGKLYLAIVLDLGSRRPPGFAMSEHHDSAVAKAALRAWHLNRRSGTDLSGLAGAINAQVRGWINYYGAFYRSELQPIAERIDEHLVRWAMQKYKRL